MTTSALDPPIDSVATRNGLQGEDARLEQGAAAAERAEVAVMERGRLARLVSRPAFADGACWTVPMLLWADICCRAASRAIAAASGATVLIGPAPLRQAWTSPAAAWASGTGGARNGRWSIELDARAARAIADAMSIGLTSLRGWGSVSGAELGLIEYAVHGAADGIARALGAYGAALDDFGCSSRRAVPEIPGGEPAFFELRCGAARGMVRVTIEAALCQAAVPDPHVLAGIGADDRGEAPETSDRVGQAPCDGLLTLELELPALRLPVEEFTAIEPGDVLLTGRAGIGMDEGPCIVGTATGWELCLTDVIDESPTRQVARLGALRPRVAAHRARGNGAAVALRAVLGRRVIGAGLLDEWPVGTPAGFEAAEPGIVELSAACGWAARCEPVRIRKELGLRVLSIRGG